MTENRDKRIIKTSVIGVLANIFLAAFKAVIGLASNSVAIVMDAVNNISDAASSVITIVGTKLASKSPDKKHPFGYGRIEYLSAMVISVIVLYAGITALVESVKKIIHPETPDYSAVALVIVAVAVGVKIILGIYVKRVGDAVNSESLSNSGKDALLDSVISAATLVAAIIYVVFGISVEAWLAAVISVVIIKSGMEMLLSALSQILGERADPELAGQIKDTINAHPEVSGAYDLVLHNYGPDTFTGSIHVEVPDFMTADEMDRLTRSITAEIYTKYGVIMTAVGVYSVNTKDTVAVEMREKLKSLVLSTEHVLQMHGFYLDEEKKIIRFDVVISFDAGDRYALFEEIRRNVQEAFPDYKIYAALDTEF